MVESWELKARAKAALSKQAGAFILGWVILWIFAAVGDLPRFVVSTINGLSAHHDMVVLATGEVAFQSASHAPLIAISPLWFPFLSLINRDCSISGDSRLCRHVSSGTFWARS
ncbi:MAG: hypothetical protein FWE26_06620 [Coriobacteriia bacterium]|nr:hypothetical protein [Coriobacteriia bacterium]